ncbi:MAG: hypothetical protein CL927_14080 [Deltaproteobacteria bacterium]|nr:hypothetical protein [Deltaproteobacteria bacterium]HCH64103.1 hypothetical protein [Deltaproteobacteria bacterium]
MSHSGSGRHIPYQPARIPIAEVHRRAATALAELDTRRSVRMFDTAPVPRRIIEDLIRTASTAPSGAHMQPWHFAAVSDPALKARIRDAAEAEERKSYAHRMSDEWKAALAPLGTDAHKPHLTDAPWLVVLFAQTWGLNPDGSRCKHYYVSESVGIAAGFFIAAVHRAGLCTLPHTPSPMGFLGDLLSRPRQERATLLLPVGFPAANCTVPEITRKPLIAVSSWFESPHDAKASE